MATSVAAGGKATRDGFGSAILKIGEDSRVVVLDADLANSTRSEWFQKKYPDRFFNVGIAEQNMVGIAAGLALSGKIPFACSFASFLAHRALDHIRVSVSYNKTNVKLIATHGGIQIGEDGPTNQSVTDIAAMRALPGMIVLQPADIIETEKAIMAAYKTEGAFYIRLTRNAVPIVTNEHTPFEIGKGIVLVDGKDCTIFASGATVGEAMKASEMLKAQGISTGVVNIHSIKPIDKELIIKKSSKPIFTVEDHSIYGGLGSAVTEVVAEHGKSKVTIIGLDSFSESATPSELYEKYGLSANRIAQRIVKEVKG